MQYTSEFKRLVIYKLLSQPGRSVRRLAEETGVAKSTIWDWKREVCRVASTMTNDTSEGPRPNPVSEARRKERSAQDKMRVVMEAEELAGPELGALLRREGITEEELEEWQDSVLWALQTSKERMADRRQVRSLEKRVRRQEKLLKENEALLKLQKKVQAMWADDEGDDTPPKSDD